MNFRDFVSVDFSISGRPSYMVKQNEDSVQPLTVWRFETEEECMLAISLWINTPVEHRNINEFRYTFTNVLRMIQAKTLWAK